MKNTIILTILFTSLCIFTFPIFASTAYGDDSFPNRLPVNRGILPPNEDKIKVVWEGKMNTTRYSAIDSCHYEGCPTAIGTRPTDMTVACPRNWKLGSLIRIDGKIYKCDDRYNADLPDRIDIWTGWDEEAHKKALEYGNKIKTVQLLTKK